jgi:hypothetical protein
MFSFFLPALPSGMYTTIVCPVWNFVSEIKPVVCSNGNRFNGKFLRNGNQALKLISGIVLKPLASSYPGFLHYRVIIKQLKFIKMTTTKKTAGKTATKKSSTKKEMVKKEVKVPTNKKEEKLRPADTIKKVKQVQERDTKQYVFSGDGKKYGKGPFVLKLVQHYVKKNPKVTEAELKKVFPDSLVSRYGVFVDLKTAIEASKNKKRYFINDDQIITVGSKKFAVTNQITSAVMEKFLAHLKENTGLKVK